MRKTLCLGCRQVWVEPREIPIFDSQCPSCGRKVIPERKELENHANSNL